MYTKAQQAFLAAVKKKAKMFFDRYPAPGHEFDHALRVANNACYIATRERAKNVFLCEVASIVHDIGRAPEHFDKKSTQKTHHEWSYELLREWFKKDPLFDFLSDKAKLEVLYAVRNHWNNMADAYDTAWILRDADKLDSFGTVGIRRARDFYSGDDAKWNMGLRFTHEMTLWFRTATAKRMFEEKRLLGPILNYYKKFLRDRVKSVEL